MSGRAVNEGKPVVHHYWRPVPERPGSVRCPRCGTELHADQVNVYSRVPVWSDCDAELAAEVMES